MSENEQPVALVVEDEMLLRLHAAGLLEEHGFAVLEAANAAEALNVLQSRSDVRLLVTLHRHSNAGRPRRNGFGPSGARALAPRLAGDCLRPRSASYGI